MARWQDLPTETVLQILTEALNQPMKRIPVYDPLTETDYELIEDIAHELHRLALPWYKLDYIFNQVETFYDWRVRLAQFSRFPRNPRETPGDKDRFTQRKISEVMVNFRTSGSLRLVDKRVSALVPEAIKEHMEMLWRKTVALRNEVEQQRWTLEERLSERSTMLDPVSRKLGTDFYLTSVKWEEAIFEYEIASDIFDWF